jgi:hypothetical protein
VLAGADAGAGGSSQPAQQPARYRLTSQFPRRVWEREGASHDGATLAAVGLGGRQEALFVELIAD